MSLLKVFNTVSSYEAAKEGEVISYPNISFIDEDGSIVYMTPPPPPPIHTLPIKAVFYDSATGNFVKMYPDEITEAIPTYTPIGVEVVPAEHDVYGTGQAGVMSLAEMNYSTPDAGSSLRQYIYRGGSGTDTSLPKYDVVNYIGKGSLLNDGVVQGAYGNTFLPSDQFSTVAGLDGKSGYYSSSYSYRQSPSPYNADGSRNEAYYTTAYSTFLNALSDFDGVGNTKVLTDLATSQSDWKTADTITNNSGAGYYPAACCAWRFHTTGTDQGQWYLPACGEFGYVINRISAINTTINKILSVYSSVVAVAMHTSNNYWSSSESSYDTAIFFLTYSGNVLQNSKDGNNYVRAFIRL